MIGGDSNMTRRGSNHLVVYRGVMGTARLIILVLLANPYLSRIIGRNMFLRALLIRLKE